MYLGLDCPIHFWAQWAPFGFRLPACIKAQAVFEQLCRHAAPAPVPAPPGRRRQGGGASPTTPRLISPSWSLPAMSLQSSSAGCCSLFFARAAALASLLSLASPQTRPSSSGSHARGVETYGLLEDEVWGPLSPTKATPAPCLNSKPYYVWLI